MNFYEQVFLSGMFITEPEIQRRRVLMDLSDSDLNTLLSCRPFIRNDIEKIVGDFYSIQLSFNEVADLIGDPETLKRLHQTQKQYILELFDGEIGVKYVNNRLRIGLVHKRIGVEPWLYLSAMRQLKHIILSSMERHLSKEKLKESYLALDKLLHFDLTLVFDTYIGGLVNEVELAKENAEEYAQQLELKVSERTRELAEKVAELETAMATVKKLEGVIPICSGCKKIRDDKESWQQLEKYLSEHSEALFSHGLCPDCYQRELTSIKRLKDGTRRA